MKDILKFWAVFSIGVAAGAAIALLSAPQAGDETRKQLKKKLDDATDYVKTTASDLGDKATRGKGYTADLADKAATAVKQGREAAGQYSDDLVDNLKSAVKQGQGAANV